jgi:hypothetical protein
MNTFETAAKFGGSFALGAFIGHLDDSAASIFQNWLAPEVDTKFPNDPTLDKVIAAAVPAFVECAIAMGAIAFFAPRAGPTNQLAYTIGVLSAMNITQFEMSQLASLILSRINF